MKYKKIKNLLVLFLIAVSLAGCAAPYSEEITSGDTSEAVTAMYATVGELADYFVKASEGYAESIGRANILDNLEESDKATRLQMLVLASRAFGKLPAPSGNAKRIAAPAPDLTEIPEWAWTDLKNMSEAGILAESDSKTMEESVTLKDAEIIAGRYFAFYGINLKDDFYTAVNRQQLNTLEIPEDSDTAGGSSSVAAATDEQLKEVILEIVNSVETFPHGSPEQKIRDLYKNFENTQSRDQAGIQPLKKYLEAVDNAGSFSELNNAISQSVLELGNFANGLFPGIPVTDTKDSSRKVLQLMTQVPGLLKEDYENPEGDSYRDYRASIIEQLTAVGESQESAERHADGILKLEKNLADNMREPDGSGKIAEQNYYTAEMLDEMMPQAKISELLQAIGLNNNVKMIVFDDVQFESYTKWFTEENLGIFKAIQK